MDFPDAVPSEEEVGSDLKSAVLGALGAEAGVVKLAAGDPFVVLPDPGALVSLSPNMEALSVLPGNMTIVSAPGEGAFDVVSRVFGPAVGIPEDPATGSAHCSISPYWGQRLAKVVITSQQASARGGYFKCRWRQPDGRVDLIGLCSTFSRGTIDI
jgi:predicted PhzF superfamily epimerase YddE/YHI9